jgi:hypothetical protein
MRDYVTKVVVKIYRIKDTYHKVTARLVWKPKKMLIQDLVSVALCNA